MKLSLGWRLYMDGAYKQAIALMVSVTPMARRDRYAVVMDVHTEI